MSVGFNLTPTFVCSFKLVVFCTAEQPLNLELYCEGRRRRCYIYNVLFERYTVMVHHKNALMFACTPTMSSVLG